MGFRMSKILILTNKKPTPNTHGEQCLELVKENYLAEVDIDKIMQEWLDMTFPSYEHFKYKRPKPEFSEFLQERMK
jgi:hypothetical protein